MKTEADILIIGAGAAGLTAMRELQVAGRDVLLLEARPRLGGRIWTQHPPGASAPVELGAEFIHGRPPGLWAFVDTAGLKVVESSESRSLAEGGDLHSLGDFWQDVAAIDSQIPLAPELTYAEFLRQATGSKAQKDAARTFAESFNAARAEILSASAIGLADEASEAIEGDRSWRFANGYDGLVDWLAATLPVDRMHLQAEVRDVRWKPGAVEVAALTSDGPRVYRGQRLVITIPLGVWRAKPGERGTIRFDPPLPTEKTEALQHLEMGHAQRFTLEFREPFWKALGIQGFLIARDTRVPVWWTQDPLDSNFITGWASGPPADAFIGLPDDQVQEQALTSLAVALGVDATQLRRDCLGIRRHDWSSDPFSRGAYSYPGVGGLAAARTLAKPVDDTLFFAGEATDDAGHWGTVHAALDSGLRAAREIRGPKS